jgi:RNA polymerase sigma-70 factor (ECF subfamily)
VIDVGATAPNPAVGWETFEALYDAQLNRVFGYLLARTGSRQTAEDLAAETFLAAARHWISGSEADVTPAWLTTVAKRRLIDHWRARDSRRRRLTKLTNERPATRSIDPLDNRLADDRVLDALASLSGRQRQALALRYLDDHAVSEVAEMMDLTYAATESLLARGRRAFTKAYEAQELQP